MEQSKCRFEMVMTPEQNKQLTQLAKQRNLSKSELVRRAVLNPKLTDRRTEKDLQLYQKLGQLSEEIKKQREEYSSNPIETLDKIVKEIDRLRLEIIRQ